MYIEWMKRGTVIIISGRRWNDKPNTYHTSSVAIVQDGTVIHEGAARFEYGYGDQYMESAFQHIAGLNADFQKTTADDVRTFYRRLAVDHGVCFVTSVVDVARRRDLHNLGR